MPAADAWQVLPHEAVEVLGDNLRWVAGTIPRVPIGRQMTVARYRDGRLLLHGPIALDEGAMAQLEAWGEVAFIYVPNAMHRMDCARFQARYPDARVICPPGAAARVGAVARVDGTIVDLPDDPDVQVEILEGTGEGEGVLSVVSGDERTLVFNDALFNVPHQPGLSGLFLRLMGSSGGPRVTRLARTLVVKDRAALRGHLERIADLPDLRRLVPGHGERIESDAAAVLREVATGL